MPLKGNTPWNKGKKGVYCLDANKWEKHWNWKGDLTHNKEHRKKIGHKQKLKRRLELLAFLGNKCIKCGFSDFRALQIDHKKGGGVQEARQIGLSSMYKRVYLYPEDYQLLCANCNWIKRYENKEFPN